MGAYRSTMLKPSNCAMALVANYSADTLGSHRQRIFLGMFTITLLADSSTVLYQPSLVICRNLFWFQMEEASMKEFDPVETFTAEILTNWDRKDLLKKLNILHGETSAAKILADYQIPISIQTAHSIKTDSEEIKKVLENVGASVDGADSHCMEFCKDLVINNYPEGWEVVYHLLGKGTQGDPLLKKLLWIYCSIHAPSSLLKELFMIRYLLLLHHMLCVRT
ncbi:unnamed protein product [Nesidiocoris tenuis]|uniref:Uncharacterized protein n=1 Tax=Nesidiocoris tenuis TaxID=355587 RepID=A0A6H5H5P9_9HEMI|nr:unnamed protein product [Nesidiocoris tenuis]